MSDVAALCVYCALLYVGFCGAVAFDRQSPLTGGGKALLAVTFVVLLVEGYRITGG